MKFGKEFTAQMIQEWQEAYMDYNQLKSILKDVLTLKSQNHPATSSTAPSNRSSQIMRKVSLSRVFSGLTGPQNRNSLIKREDDTIFVSLVRQGGVEERYQTMLLKSSAEGGVDKEVLFFRRLDEEFNKVLSFYRKKVDEVVAEADELTNQMDALIGLRIRVSNPGLNMGDRRAENVHAANTHQHHNHHHGMDTIQEEEERGGRGRDEGREMSAMMRPSPLQVLDHVQINVGPKTPISALRALLSSPSTKDQLKKSEELMVQAFVEFYQKLTKLKRYCFMNQLAFSKIMKKYDKITLKNASKSYLDMVDKSYLGTCDKVTKLMKRVEAAFVKHFANGNHGKGMEILRPKKRNESHRVTFSLGFLSGCSIALLVTILVIIQSRNIINNPGRIAYMQNVFPLYILFGFIVLHMICFSANIYYWRRHRINYPFIFGIKEGTELSYREVFLLSAGLSVVTLAAVVSNLDMDMDRRTNRFATLPELVPLILLGVLVLILLCPLNILYRSTRYFLITCLFRCLLAPFYKVTLPDFFMADQLTSQVQSFRSLQFYVCYYIWGNFTQRDSNMCLKRRVYQIFYIAVAMIPFWFRFLQCVRRFIEERGPKHFFNALKYLTIMVALAARTIYVQQQQALRNLQQQAPSNLQQQEPSTFLYIIAVSTSGIATIYATYWDIVIDWGLLRRNSRNPWLRDKLILSNKTVYVIAIILNCILRVAWMQSVSGFTQAPYLHRKAMIALVACLEIIRRGIWNFFRVENEHLNNVGKYRAFKSVPLPFSHDYGAKHT